MTCEGGEEGGGWAVDVDCARPDVQKRVHSAARKVCTAAASLPASCDQGGKQEVCPVSGGNIYCGFTD